MTDKRFTLNSVLNFDFGICDYGEPIGSLRNICELLNELHEANEGLKEYNNKLMKQPLLFDVQTIPDTMEIMKANTQLEEENQHIKHTIKTMMENERTELGRSVLKQLWEAIQ